MDDGEIVPPITQAPMPEPVSVSAAQAFHCDRTTIARDMEASDLFGLLEVILGSPLAVTLSPEQYGALRPDVRRHFRRVR